MGTGALGTLVKAAIDAYVATLTDTQKREWLDAQRLDLQKAMFNPVEDWVYGLVGVVQSYAGVSVPSGWLLCDGSSLLRSGTYASLFAAITKAATVTISHASPAVVTWNGHGLLTGDCISFETTSSLPAPLAVDTMYYIIYVNANTFNVATSYANALAGTKVNTTSDGAGVQTCRFNPYGIVDGTHFNIPDMIGASPRGSGLSTGYIANVTVNQGHKDDDKMQGHYHQVRWYTSSGSGSQGGITGAGNSYNKSTQFAGDSLIRTEEATTDGVNGTPRTGTETKMKNVGVNYIIKY